MYFEDLLGIIVGATWLYAVPFCCFVGILNNVIILILMHGFAEIKKAIPISVRIYYLAFAWSDLAVLFSYYVNLWLRKFI